MLFWETSAQRIIELICFSVSNTDASVEENHIKLVFNTKDMGETAN